MGLEFKELRDRVNILDVLARRGIKLRHKMGSDYASGPCPLRAHPKEDRGTSFGVHLPTNRFQCKNATCQKENGVGDKWGDCINLLVSIEGIGFKDAARKLDEMFPKEKPASNGSGVTGSPRASSVVVSPANTLEGNNSSGNGKGFMASLRPWWDDLLKCDDWEVVRKAVFEKIYESYKNGKSAART
jgi:hypothetical protein